jgi:hypothetical protein
MSALYLIPMKTKYLPDHPGDMMTDYTVPYFFTDRYPYSVIPAVILPYDHNKQTIDSGGTAAIDRLEISVFFLRIETYLPIFLTFHKNEKRKGHIAATYADNLFLPFALRLAKTFLPLAVLSLFLKPCSFALCLFFG